MRTCLGPLKRIFPALFPILALVIRQESCLVPSGMESQSTGMHVRLEESWDWPLAGVWAPPDLQSSQRECFAQVRSYTVALRCPRSSLTRAGFVQN